MSPETRIKRSRTVTELEPDVYGPHFDRPEGINWRPVFRPLSGLKRRRRRRRAVSPLDGACAMMSWQKKDAVIVPKVISPPSIPSQKLRSCGPHIQCGVRLFISRTLMRFVIFTIISLDQPFRCNDFPAVRV